jgi:phosphoglycerol transferase MdoB-like AlkP superfamily enzyme
MIRISELFNTFWLGFRFDLKLLATVMIPVYLVSLLRLNRLSETFPDRFLAVILVMLVLLGFANYGYYQFFGNEFNALLFGIVNDGTSEVLRSIVSDKTLVLLLISAVAVSSLLYYIWQRLGSRRLKDSYLFHLVLLVIMLLLARGSVGTFPLNKKTINNVDNVFLSNALLNPVWQLYYAYKDLRLNHITTPEKVLKKHKLKSYRELLTKAGYTQNSPLRVQTPEDPFLKRNRPNIVFVLMESWSSYITLFNSKENDVLGSFDKHMKDDYFFPRFFSNAYGTNPTIEALLLNSPVKDLSQSQAKDTKFSLFALDPFLQQGYRSVFLSGGSSSWRNHNRFWKTQGFENYIGRATIEKYYHTVCDNTWCVYDELLFGYLEEEVFKKDDTPFFAFVLTTNNHPPVELPEDFRMPKIDLSYYGLSNDDEEKKRRLGAFNYQTNALGNFLSWLKNSKYKDNTIVVATGDHIIKGFKDYKLPDEMFYKYGVPLYLYVPKQYDKLKDIDQNLVGSHNDIFPTLYHLALSQAEYYNFGTPLMQKEKHAFGWNEQEKYLFYSGVSDGKNRYTWDDNLTVDSIPKPLSRAQSQQITMHRYRNILIEYLLNLEFKKMHQ